jgi:hypothetical protein
VSQVVEGDDSSVALGNVIQTLNMQACGQP